MPTHYDDRRRDTPAFDGQARRAQQGRSSAMAAATGRDTPAQERNLQRQQTPAQGRTVARERIDREQSRADRIGQQPGPAGRAMQAGTAAVGDWRQQALQADQAGPQAQATRGGSFPSMPSSSSDGGRSADGSGFTASQIADSEGTGWGRGMLDIRAPGRALREDGLPQTQQRGLPGPMDAWQAGQRVAQHLAGQPVGRQGQQQPQPASVSRETPPTQVSQGAIQAAQGVDASRGQGYFAGPDGQRQYMPGTQRVPDGPGGVRGPSVMGDMGAAGDEFARANAIRQETIDRQRPQNQVTMIPDSGGQGQGPEAQIERLIRQAGRTSNARDRATINRQIRQLEGVAERQGAMQRAGMTQDTQLEQTRMTQQGAGERTAAQIASRAMETDQGQQAYQQARAEYQQMVNERMRTGADLEPPELDTDAVQAMVDSGNPEMAQQELLRFQAQRDAFDMGQILRETQMSEQDLLDAYMQGELDPEDRVYELMERTYGPAPQGYADGGEVMAPGMGMEESMGPQAGAMSMVGDPVATGMAQPPQMPQPDPQMQQQYQQYMQGAQQLGIQAIPFEEFVQMAQPQAPQGAPQAPQQQEQFGGMGFALGGEIPDLNLGDDPYDASGQLVMDTDPMAGEDSIPAVIDEQHPAKLDSGEFVIPESVVRYHGLEKLNKLIAQAEQDGQDGSGQREASATQAVRSQA